MNKCHTILIFIILLLPYPVWSKWSFEQEISSIVNLPFMPPVTAEIIDTGRFPIQCGEEIGIGCFTGKNQIFVQTEGLPHEIVRYALIREIGKYFDPLIWKLNEEQRDKRADMFYEAINNNTYLKLLRKWNEKL
jgi:hypothetical protein